MRRIRGGFAISGCVLVLIVLFLLVSMLNRGGRGGSTVGPTPPLKDKAEFTARDGMRRFSISRKQDRFRVESGSGGDEHNVVCIGTLGAPNDRWIVIVPEKRQYFYWSPTRGASDDKTLAGSRLFRAVMDRKYTLAGGDSLHALPGLVSSLTQFHPDPGANVRLLPRDQGKYELVEYDHVRSEPVPMWKYGPVLYRRTVHEGALQWCPELGLAWSSVSDVSEGPLDPTLFEVPAGYAQLFAGDTESLPKPVLTAALTQGWRAAPIGPGFTYEDIDGKWGHGIAIKESATHGATGQRDYGQLQCRRIDFDSADVAERYAEQARLAQPNARRERAPLTEYRVWEKAPTAGQASFWRDHGQLVFRRGGTVVELSAFGYRDDDNAMRHHLVGEVAAAVDRQLKGGSASPASKPLSPSPSPADDW